MLDGHTDSIATESLESSFVASKDSPSKNPDSPMNMSSLAIPQRLLAGVNYSYNFLPFFQSLLAVVGVSGSHFIPQRLLSKSAQLKTQPGHH